MNSTPSLHEFDPNLIPFQKKVIVDVRKKYNYSAGIHEILLSGSVGSAKSILMAHLVVTHCLINPYARVLIGRKVMKDLKDTLIQTITEHIENTLEEGKDYTFNRSAQKWRFSNGSEIISRSWDNKNFKQFRSLALSGVAIEEITENDEKYKGFYFELIQRVGRLPHVKENFIISATNPDGPSHWAYKHFMIDQKPTRHVYYSKTSDNPFLPESYITQLRETLDPKQALRMLEGQWVDIDQERIYYNYERDRNFRKQKYQFVQGYPIDISHDFNIGEGKPMSAVVSQYIDGKFHCAKVFAVEGARTKDILDEMYEAGVFSPNFTYRIFGDATGKSRDTRSIKSDYDIIKEFLSNLEPKINFEMLVPLANPPVRARHNLVNAQFLNANGQINLFVYEDAELLDEGFRMTKLKSGGNYIEDDSFRAQHCTTAIGYAVYYLLKLIPQHKKAYRR